jgi:hypothetical protein
VAGVGVLIAGSRGEAAPENQRTAGSDELQIGLIGTGAQGLVLLNACLKIPHVRFRAVCDIWESYNLRRAHRMLEKFGHKVNAYEDYRQLIAREKGLDGVLIATPDFWHAQQTVDCLAWAQCLLRKRDVNTVERPEMVRA